MCVRDTSIRCFSTNLPKVGPHVTKLLYFYNKANYLNLYKLENKNMISTISFFMLKNNFVFDSQICKINTYSFFFDNSYRINTYNLKMSKFKFNLFYIDLLGGEVNLFKPHHVFNPFTWFRLVSNFMIKIRFKYSRARKQANKALLKTSSIFVNFSKCAYLMSPKHNYPNKASMKLTFTKRLNYRRCRRIRSRAKRLFYKKKIRSYLLFKNRFFKKFFKVKAKSSTKFSKGLFKIKKFYSKYAYFLKRCDFNVEHYIPRKSPLDIEKQKTLESLLKSMEGTNFHDNVSASNFSISLKRYIRLKLTKDVPVDRFLEFRLDSFFKSYNVISRKKKRFLAFLKILKKNYDSLRVSYLSFAKFKNRFVSGGEFKLLKPKFFNLKKRWIIYKSRNFKYIKF